MGMVHCYRCSLPGHYAVFEKPLFTLLYLLTVTLIFLYVKELPFSTFHL